ncbi:adenosine receptor A3-like [Oculina patagonica]
MEADREEVADGFCISLRLIGSYEMRFLVAGLNIFLAICATLANTVILAALHKESSLHPPSKILLRSLALTDFFAGILVEPLFVTVLITVDENQNLCYQIIIFTLFTAQVLCLLSLLTLTAISVDRLLALLLGMRYRQVVTFKRVLLCVICFWTLSTGFATAVFWVDYSKANLYLFFIVDLLCITISTCCYIKICQKLLHHQAQIHVHQGQPNGHEPLNIARYRKTVSSALWVQFTVLACYLPTGIVAAWMAVSGILVNQSLFVAWLFLSTLMFFNSTLNPILYCWKIREVRRAVIDIRRLILCCFIG